MIGLIMFVLAASGLGAVLVSLLVERLRRHPDSPAEIKWAPHLPVRYVSVNGHAMRYVKTGNGPALVLLHTMRTQLDIYQKMIAELATRFTVYAPDLPAHGWSDIPREPVSVELLTKSVAGFLEALEIKDAIVAGQSI
ncbi:MAG: alpha/beta fold hydrolase, partial [Gammaproteobacteria bacterium]|nr:alpha/beta fold hydrolase [Gammaproteobacteria bacterium]